ncbi:MAG: Asp-tRNA(Asn)/Glu-tRNA(Gln) amidotransferase subunit GatB [Thermoanaerobaculia bacterium]|nr:Asp-tRNA(Asn)/Glu-tRNA(Gln) amidotransferase subunit GatB [Thermoanaerobaculia bacterium]
MSWEAVIGLEVHVQLATRSKLFAPVSATFGAEPNSQVTALCAALPGTLPVVNRRAVELALTAGLAVDGELARTSRFARKHYFYPDLPKGYQISQYDRPLFTGGRVRFPLGERGGWRDCRLKRIHVEEDAGKLIHAGDFSLVDLNRAGTPLVEIVTEPDLATGEEAGAFLRYLRRLLRHLEVSDCNMEEGSLRCDANVSVRRAGDSALGTRAEVKNMNSFRFVERAIAAEIERQVGRRESGRAVVQETRLFDEATGGTRAMRGKEEADDYRYFPDPDLPPLVVGGEWAEAIRRGLPELPGPAQERYETELGLSRDYAAQLAGTRETLDWFEEVLAAGAEAGTAAALVVQYLLPEAGRREVPVSELPLSAATVAAIAERVDDERLTKRLARRLIEESLAGDEAPAAILARLEADAASAAEGLAAVVERVLAEHPGPVAEYRAGKTKTLGFLIGRALAASGEGADPVEVRRALLAALRADG